MADTPSSPSSLTNISSETQINGVPHKPTSIMDIPSDILLIIIRRLGKISLESLVNVKATCTTMRDLGEDPYVVKSLSINQIPMLFEVESPAIEKFIDMALIAGNYQALFRHAFVHLFCAGGDFQYGYQVLSKVAKKGFHNAIYLRSLVLASHAGCPNHHHESSAIRLWVSIYDPGRMERIRDRLQPWFQVLAPRLIGGNIFRVRGFAQCNFHHPNHKRPRICIRCRLDLEVRWFVESMGREYVMIL